MVMNGQVTDFFDVLFGEMPVGDVNFVVPPRQREFDQELDVEDINRLIEVGEELSLIPDVDNLLGDDCQVHEAAVIEVQTQETSCTPPTSCTPSTSYTSQSESVFMFPDTCETVEITDLISDVKGSTYLEDDEASYLSCSSSQYSPSLPPTPSTASSTDSNSSHIPTFLKQGLKNSIQNKRLQLGKAPLRVEFRKPEPEKLTAEEAELRRLRREKNKFAAQKCRSKKRERAEVLEAETKELECNQKKLKTEIQQLKEEKENLMDLLKVHTAVCPKLRAQSSSF